MGTSANICYMEPKTNDLTIIKIGTNALVDKDGKVIQSTIAEVFSAAKTAMERGINVLVVTSGAARIGRAALGDMTAPKKVATCVGQPVLFGAWQKEAEKKNIKLAEFLISRSSVIRKELFLGLRNTFTELFLRGVVPVVNENDVLVNGTDLSFGEAGNDSLAQALAVSLKATRLIIVSDIKGLYDRDPRDFPEAVLIPEVDDVTGQFISCSSKKPSANSSGGMLSKLKSIRISTAVGVECYIVSGLESGNIKKAVDGEPVGTRFLAHKRGKKVSERERWILAAKSSSGSVVIDQGAIDAIKTGASLLAVGVKKVYGSFNEKEVIEIVDQKNRGIAFGIVDMSCPEIEDMLRTKDTHQKLLIHANNLFLLN